MTTATARIKTAEQANAVVQAIAAKPRQTHADRVTAQAIHQAIADADLCRGIADRAEMYRSRGDHVLAAQELRTLAEFAATRMSDLGRRLV